MHVANTIISATLFQEVVHRLNPEQLLKMPYELSMLIAELWPRLDVSFQEIILDHLTDEQIAVLIIYLAEPTRGDLFRQLRSRAHLRDWLGRTERIDKLVADFTRFT